METDPPKKEEESEEGEESEEKSDKKYEPETKNNIVINSDIKLKKCYRLLRVDTLLKRC